MNMFIVLHSRVCIYVHVLFPLASIYSLSFFLSFFIVVVGEVISGGNYIGKK